jgi:hypothetical protein
MHRRDVARHHPAQGTRPRGFGREKLPVARNGIVGFVAMEVNGQPVIGGAASPDRAFLIPGRFPKAV